MANVQIYWTVSRFVKKHGRQTLKKSEFVVEKNEKYATIFLRSALVAASYSRFL